jgi:hypothetical protein
MKYLGGYVYQGEWKKGLREGKGVLKRVVSMDSA